MAKAKKVSTPTATQEKRAFRSPLQAKWAAFLDALATPYDYERYSYEFRGAGYRPHFLVEQWNCWVETVPGPLAKIDIFRCLELSRQSERAVILIVGEPIEHTIVLFDPTGYFPKEGSGGWQFGQGQTHADEVWLACEDGAFTLRGVDDGQGEALPLLGDDASRIMDALAHAQDA